MKLAKRLILALLLVIVMVLMVQIRSRTTREAQLFEDDMRRDHLVLARGLGLALSEVWEQEGEASALDLLARAGGREPPVQFRWVWLDGADPDHRPMAAAEVLAPMLEGAREVGTIDRGTDEPGRLYTYYAPQVSGLSRPGAIELSESLAAQRSYVEASVVRQTLWGLLVAVAAVLAVTALSVYFVGRPVAQLISQARRVGLGDLSLRLTVDQDDELGDLAQAMNAMCDRLQESQAQVQAETAARDAALHQLRHADRLMTVGKLASGLAHELGTPLNVVGARGQMIATGELVGADAMDSGRIIWEQTERMTRLLRQLLEFARRRRPESAPEELGALITRTLDLLAPLARRRGVRLQGPPPEVQLTAPVDAAQIQQVISNLVVNAVHASPQGGSVEISLYHKDLDGPAQVPCGCICVEDQGQGISPEHLPHVFEPFFTTKDVGEGTGLGLSVAWGIVADHRGTITADSVKGGGARFCVYLPLSRPDTEPS